MRSAASLETIIRRGLETIKPYESGRPISVVEKELGISEAIKLASNESPYTPFEKVIEVMRDEAPAVNRYPDAGCTFLREKIAEKLNVPASQVIVGNGSNELLVLLADVLLNPEDNAVFADPSFIIYQTAVKLMNAKSVIVPLEGHTHDLNAMADAIDENTKIVFICNPNNPTGTIVRRDEVERFLERVPETVVTIFDEAYFELVNDPEYPNGLDYINGDKPVVVLRTFSKVHGLAGLRVGYGIAPEVIATTINKVREPFNVNSIAQAAAMASLDCDAEVAERSRLNYQGLHYFYKEFDRLKLDYIPSHANFVLVDIGTNDREASLELMKRGIIVRSGDIFGYPNYLRLSVGTPDENARFIGALEDLIRK
ncbi:MAG TPA: histidinol-phosphate transaminase [Candidatus Aquicultor sp.]|jgi:histidinol-phosphate aminotransferase